MKCKQAAGILVALVLTISLGLSGCGSAPSQAANTAAPTDVTGIYTNFMSGEMLRDRLVGSWSAVTHLDTLHQYNTLVLTAANTVMSSDRYELTKDLYNGEMGIHIEGRFYGEYSFEGNEVKLHVPEYYTFIYYRNGQLMRDAIVYQPVNPNATESDNDGCNFFGDYIEYHGIHRVKELPVTVNLNDMTFAFNLEENTDQIALGVEDEPAFNALPIFSADYAEKAESVSEADTESQSESVDESENTTGDESEEETEATSSVAG